MGNIAGGYTLAKDVVSPNLIDKDDRHQYESGHRHNGQGVLSGGSVGDSQAPVWVETGNHKPGEHAGKESQGYTSDCQ